jgi:hypothetical protein
MSSSLKPLTLELIQGGRLLDEINDAIVRVSDDVIHRNLLDEDRVVTVKITIKPGKPEDGRNGPIVLPRVNASIATKIPGVAVMETRTLIDDFRGKSVLMVNTNDFTGDPRQTTVFDNLPQEEDSRPPKE